jgi:hypothetical protein
MNGRWARAPDTIQPIVGYRAWSYTISGRRARLFPLGSVVDDDEQSPWDGGWRGWVTASCSLPASESGHVAPEEDCTCGFYATKSLDDFPEIVASTILQAAGDRMPVVMGRVELAGKVIEHESGYRAERARVAELIPIIDDVGITLRLASRLDLPIGPSLDPSPEARAIAEAMSQMEERSASLPVAAARPGLIDRWRLMRHRRHFRLIDGDGAAGDTGHRPPSLPGPSGEPFPPAA